MTPRRVARAERGSAPPAPELELAGEDLLIERPDLGPGACTLIAAGDPIPAALAGLPRQKRGRP